jgi:hypothetical protein
VSVRRLVPLCTLTAAGMVVGLAGPAFAHESPAHYERTALAAAPATEGEGVATDFVANLQYELLPGGASFQGGSDIEFMTLGEKDYALAGTLRNGMQIVDITDPTKPTLAGVYACPITQGDIQVFRQGDRVLATYTADAAIAPTDNSGNRTPTNQARFESQCVTEFDAINAQGEDDFDGTELGTFIVDVTDPTKPTTLSFLEVPEGSHNQTVHPSGDYLYNSNSDLIGFGGIPNITIHDISDAANPREVKDFTYPPGQPALGEESHDIFFNGDGTRAYVASLGSTLILDTSNPEDPKIVTQFVDPENDLVHQSDLVSLPREDGTVRDLLIVTDEQAGALPQSTCPGGGLHVYDITGDRERASAATFVQRNKLGVWFIPAVEPAPGETCTSHVLRIYPDQKMLTIAWYSQGVRTLDISGLADFDGSPADVAFGDGIGMREVGSFFFPEDSDTWSFKTNRIEADGSFFGYGNDIGRGLDVYRFDGTAGELGRTVPVLEPADLLAPGCDAAPVATGYADRDDAREVHQRSVDCVISRSIAVGSVQEGGQRVFLPAEDVTRGQMATFIVNTLRAGGIDAELPVAPKEDAFGDIGESAHRDSINVLAAAGIVTGNAGSFEPEALVSRAQMATFMLKAADFAVDPDLASTGGSRFSDVQAGDTHADSIETGADNGLFSGVTASTFSQEAMVQRDQMASFLVNLLERIDA